MDNKKTFHYFSRIPIFPLLVKSHTTQPLLGAE
jgi:hypothetical protein